MTQDNNDKPADPQTSPPETGPTLHVAPSPHIQDRSNTTRRMMLDVLIAMIPLAVAATIFFDGWAWYQLGICIGSCLAAETLLTLMRRQRPTLGDFSAVVTGGILAFSLPWNAPWYVGVIGSFVAIGLGKAIFGGGGVNLFNPAMVGRAFVMLSFAGAVGAPAYVQDVQDNPFHEHVEVISGATPMTALAEDHAVTPLADLLWGNTYGSLGETSAVACLLGGAYLLIRRTADWRIPAGVLIATTFIAALISLHAVANTGGGVMGFLGDTQHWGLLHELLGGALLFGAFYIATDPVSSPVTGKGKFLFGLGVGAFIMLIRKLSNYPEGVMFAILLMNAVTPLVNRWTIPKPLGEKARTT